MTTNKKLRKVTVWCGDQWQEDLHEEARSAHLKIKDDADHAEIKLRGAKASDVDRDLEDCPVLASDADGIAYEGEVVDVEARGVYLKLKCTPASEGPLMFPPQSLMGAP